MHRRDWLKWTGASAGVVGLPWLAVRAVRPAAAAQTQGPPAAAKALAGLPALKITDVQTILTAPANIRLVVVKVLTSEPGLYGLGCATFTQRPRTVETAVN